MTKSTKIALLLCLYQLGAPLCAAGQVGTEAPAPQTGAEEQPFKYTGNLCSRKFHRPRCPFSRVMAEYKRTRFHFRYQAVAQGYKPCRYCLPPFWTTVRATIKCQDIDKTSQAKKSADKSADDIDAKAHLGTSLEGSGICGP